MARFKDLERRTYYRAIVEYVEYSRFCRQSRQRATVASARQFMEQTEGRRRPGVSQLATEGVNWFFNMARSVTGPTCECADRPGRPRPVPGRRSRPWRLTDMGGPDMGAEV